MKSEKVCKYKYNNSKSKYLNAGKRNDTKVQLLQEELRWFHKEQIPDMVHLYPLLSQRVRQ